MTETLTATLTTTQGTVTIRLFPDHAPKTVRNFVELAEGGREWTDPRTRARTKDKLYDGTIFHRVIAGFMIQGGCPEGSGRGGPGYRFEDELPAPGKYQIGSLAMANAGPNTNGSQFFIVSGASGVSLPPQYSLFGKLISGLDVLDSIEKVRTGSQDRPKDDVVINSITISEE